MEEWFALAAEFLNLRISYAMYLNGLGEDYVKNMKKYPDVEQKTQLYNYQRYVGSENGEVDPIFSHFVAIAFDPMTEQRALCYEMEIKMAFLPEEENPPREQKYALMEISQDVTHEGKKMKTLIEPKNPLGVIILEKTFLSKILFIGPSSGFDKGFIPE